jgi:hypothetical protein
MLEIRCGGVDCDLKTMSLYLQVLGPILGPETQYPD